MGKIFLNLIVVSMMILGTVSCDDVDKEESTYQDIPSQSELVRLARQGLKNIHVRRVNIGFVEICGDFPDGSKEVKVFTESGNYVKGRLFKDRARYQIAIDKKDFYSEKITINRDN